MEIENEKYIRDVCYVLQEIKEQSPYGSPIVYHINWSLAAGHSERLSPDNEFSILKNLEKDGAIKIQNPEGELIDTGHKVFYITLKPDFDKIYKKINENIEESIDRKNEKRGDESEIIRVETKHGTLVLNKSTGDVKLKNSGTKLNPISKEFKIIFALMTNPNHQATYKELIGENPSKDNKRNLTFTVRNIKEVLCILPKDSARNKDCILNVKRYGYRLDT